MHFLIFSSTSGSIRRLAGKSLCATLISVTNAYENKPADTNFSSDSDGTVRVPNSFLFELLRDTPLYLTDSFVYPRKTGSLRDLVLVIIPKPSSVKVEENWS